MRLHPQSSLKQALTISETDHLRIMLPPCLHVRDASWSGLLVPESSALAEKMHDHQSSQQSQSTARPRWVTLERYHGNGCHLASHG